MLDPKYTYGFRNLNHFGAPVSIDGFLNDEEIEKIKQCSTWYDPIQAGVCNAEQNSLFVVNPEIRKGEVVFLPFSEKMEWFFKKLRNAIDHVNDTYFRYNIVFLETLQYSIYNVGDHYDHHRDVHSHGVNSLYEQRKLSFTIQLSDDEDYKGGDLEFYHPANPVQSNRKKGSMTVFPSFHYHRVTPVTEGRRLALVGWIVGPDFQ